MRIDTSTLKQLEIISPKPISLNQYFNASITNEGQRVTEYEIAHPKVDINQIKSTQQVIQ